MYCWHFYIRVIRNTQCYTSVLFMLLSFVDSYFIITVYLYHNRGPWLSLTDDNWPRPTKFSYLLEFAFCFHDANNSATVLYVYRHPDQRVGLLTAYETRKRQTYARVTERSDRQRQYIRTRRSSFHVTHTFHLRPPFHSVQIFFARLSRSWKW